MKRHLVYPLLSLLLASPLSTIAQEPLASKEGAIRSLEEQERTAVLKEDVAALGRLWSDQFIVNNPQNQISADRNAVLDRVKRGLIRYSQFERRIETIRFNEDIAIVMGSETVVPKSDAANPAPAVQRRFTNIWRESSTTWHMIARHANVVARGAGAAETPEDLAQKSAESWLNLVDGGKYEDSWTQASSLFKSKVTKAQWQQAATGGVRPLGKLVSRQLKSRQLLEKLPGAPDGKYVVIQYDSVFEHKSSAVETVTPTLDADGVWRVSGYFIK